MRKNRVLFIYRDPSPFILSDRALLEKHFDVIEFRWADHSHPARALVRWMLSHRRENDVVFIWFGDTHAWVACRTARIARKPSIIQVGGYDVSDIPGYGFLSTQGNARRARSHFQLASRIIAVSHSLADSLARRFPVTASKTTVLPTGVDVDRFKPQGSKEPLVLSVAFVDSATRLHIKGWDRLAEIARSRPDLRFRLIGASGEVRMRFRPVGNLEVREASDQDDLIPEYQSAAVYAQLSRSEGMPNSVMEAMACGCVPVVTPVGGMPELVREAGFVVNEQASDVASALDRALDRPNLGERARARIKEQFSLAHRERGLVEIIEQALGTEAPR